MNRKSFPTQHTLQCWDWLWKWGCWNHETWQRAPSSKGGQCKSVCLSVCHNYAPCLNHSSDLVAIWQVHLWRLMTHTLCQMWGP